MVRGNPGLAALITPAIGDTWSRTAAARGLERTPGRGFQAEFRSGQARQKGGLARIIHELHVRWIPIPL